MESKNMTEGTSLEQQLLEMKQAALKSFSKAISHAELESVRQEYLGQKGALTSILRGLSQIDQNARATVGRQSNEIKAELESIYLEQKKTLEQKDLEHKLKT